MRGQRPAALSGAPNDPIFLLFVDASSNAMSFASEVVRIQLQVATRILQHKQASETGFGLEERAEKQQLNCFQLWSGYFATCRGCAQTKYRAQFQWYAAFQDCVENEIS
ncbi:Hypothetical_protein [Hexamita inflata]|uniref:Hypothetical_protein n=1 Tax=Hexamita inflata TaxID=28002 RepID=A0ABP1JU96_9EUKA